MDSSDLKKIKKAIALMDEHGLSHFEMEKDGFSLTLKKRDEGIVVPSNFVSSSSMPASGEEDSVSSEKEGEAILSPMVGLFYRKTSPESAPFVEVGTTISEGQTLCIIEAMKVMNEIKAEKSGKIIEVLVEDGAPVQFGDSLFRIS